LFKSFAVKLLRGPIVGMVCDMTYTLKVEQNETTGECHLILPEALLEKMQWKTDDNIDWHSNNDGSFTLKKI